MIIYGDLRSGNCLKVKYTADKLGLGYEWVDVDIIAAESRTPDFLAMNPAGQVPCVRFEDGRVLAQSNAIVLYLADGTGLMPSRPYDRARVWELLFWEQYSHEPYIAVCRFQKLYLGKADAELDPNKVERGYGALDFMETRLRERDWLVGTRLSVADIVLLAYTRVADEGGFDVGKRAAVLAWIDRTERELGLL